MRFAEAIATRLSAVAPPPFTVRAVRDIPSPFGDTAGRSWVAIYRGDEFDGASDLSTVLDGRLPGPGGSPASGPMAEALCSAAWHLLSSLQDAVTKATTDPLLGDTVG
jgi:hypothetical protein